MPTQRQISDNFYEYQFLSLFVVQGMLYGSVSLWQITFREDSLITEDSRKSFCLDNFCQVLIGLGTTIMCNFHIKQLRIPWFYAENETYKTEIKNISILQKYLYNKNKMPCSQFLIWTNTESKNWPNKEHTI